MSMSITLRTTLVEVRSLICWDGTVTAASVSDLVAAYWVRSSAARTMLSVSMP
jgi:hypothetical protein